MGVRYLNWNGETIDEINRGDFPDHTTYRAERRRLVSEYALAGMGGAYWSQRPCANWKD